jgi:DNA-binding LytR/AlgR family response regulator
MLNISIVDDENTQTLLLSNLVKQWAYGNNKPISVQTFPSAESFHFAWCQDHSFDILLLDIQMQGMNGVELAKEIRKSDEKLCIIFITGLADYIESGYDVSALHYLLKPVNEGKLFACLDKACSRISIEQPTIVVTSQGQTIRILQREIIFAEASAHYVQLLTTACSHEIKMNISELEKMLAKNLFIRCHRSYIIGIRYISKIGKTDLTLDNGKTIPVSRRLYHEVNQAFINFFREAAI